MPLNVKREADRIVISKNHIPFLIFCLLLAVLFGDGLVNIIGRVGKLEFSCHKENLESRVTDCTVTFKPRFQIFPTEVGNYYEIKRFDCLKIFTKQGKIRTWRHYFVMRGNWLVNQIPLPHCDSWGSRRAEQLNTFLQSPQQDISFVEDRGIIDWANFIFLLLFFGLSFRGSVYHLLLCITEEITISRTLDAVTRRETGLLFANKKIYPLADVVFVLIERGKWYYTIEMLFTGGKSLVIASKFNRGEAEKLARQISEFVGCGWGWGLFV